MSATTAKVLSAEVEVEHSEECSGRPWLPTSVAFIELAADRVAANGSGYPERPSGIRPGSRQRAQDPGCPTPDRRLPPGDEGPANGQATGPDRRPVDAAGGAGVRDLARDPRGRRR